MHPFYTSRSAIECYQHCPRKRWLGYLYGGRGLAATRANVPLTTGTCIHTGVAFLLRNVMQGLIMDVSQSGIENWVDSAVSIALQEYQKVVSESGIQVKENEDSAFVYAQECAKTEALVRAWAIAELPILVKEYEIYSVEDEIVVPLSVNVLLQARVDAILKSRRAGEFIIIH